MLFLQTSILFGGAFMSDSENKTIQNIVKDKVFIKKIMGMKMKEAQNAFAKRGVSLSQSDMVAIRDSVQAKINGQDSLSEQILNNVGGGASATERLRNIAIAISALAIGGSVAALGYKGYMALDKLDDTIKTSKDSMTKFGAASDSLKSTSEKAENLVGKVNAMEPKINSIVEKSNKIVTDLNDPKKRGWVANLFLGGEGGNPAPK